MLMCIFLEIFNNFFGMWNLLSILMECSCMATLTIVVMVMSGFFFPTVILEYGYEWVIFVVFVFKGMLGEPIMAIC